MKKYTVSEESSLKNFTDNVCAQASFCFRTLLKTREIRVNGQKVSRDVPLRKGDIVQYFLTPAQESRSAFSISYEDENVIVADKESGVNSEAVFSALREVGEVFFIHRLDRNTQGLLIFAKNERAAQELLGAFRSRRVEKIYYALVVGKPQKKHAVEEAYLVKDDGAARVRVSAKPAGEKIVTEYEVTEERGDACLLKITLHTGKTHQIRAHMAYLGHPVAGDEKYGDEAFNRAHAMTRQRLVAKELTLYPQGSLEYLTGRKFTSVYSL